MWALQGIKSSSLATSMTSVLLHSKGNLFEFGQDCSLLVDFLQEREACQSIAVLWQSRHHEN